MTATLIAAVIIGQLGITVTGPLKPFFFLMFLFAIGYAVGPQFVRGIAKDGLPQALFAVVCVFCLMAAFLAAKLAGYDVGSAAGLYAGSQTISASMGLGTDAINRLGLPPEETKNLLDAMPVAYAVTYIFGTVGSAIVIALFGPAFSGIDLETPASATRRSTAARRRRADPARPGTSSTCAPIASGRRPGRRHDRRGSGAARSRTARLHPAPAPRRGDHGRDLRHEIQAGDIVAIAGRRDVLADLIGAAAEEVDDRELLAVPAEGVDVYVTSKEVDGKTLGELAGVWARGVFLRKIARGATAIEIPILPDTEINRGDILTLVGRTQDVSTAAKALGYADQRPTSPTSCSSAPPSPSARSSARW